MEKIADAAYRMGLCYYRGTNGYPLDHNKAFKFASAAAKAGNDDAMHLLGILYKNGEGTEQNYQLAIDWFYKAIQTNNENGFAAFNLGKMYYFGTGIEKNYDLAFKFLDCAILLALGNTRSYYPVACFYAGSILIEKKEYERSVTYFVDASKYGNLADAWHNLGWLAEKGYPKSVPNENECTALAFNCYEKAANLGHIDSLFDTGRIYLQILEKEKAMECFRKAAAHGHKQAEKMLKMMNLLR